MWRRKSEDLWPIVDHARGCLARECEPHLGTIADQRLVYAGIDHPAAASCVAMLQRYGVSINTALQLKPDDVERRRAESPPANGRQEARLFGDPADLSFSDSQEMEEAVERMMEHPNVRQALSRSVADRVRRHYTTASLAPKIIDLVRRSLT